MRVWLRLRLIMFIAMGIAIGLAGCTARRVASKAANPAPQTKGYDRTSMCKGCHDQIVAQHLQSEHERSFTNPAFQAQYRKDLLPKAQKEKDLNLYAEARECIACHEPISYAMKGPSVISLQAADPEMNGVTCDVCHRITGYSGAKPQNGNYIIAPSEQKLGPFKEQSDWHHTYSEFQTKSEICAVCHEAVNNHGLRIKATFTEWRESVFSRQGVQCQDCHMNVDGFLTAGKPRFSSGKAASMTLGSSPQRERLYTHQFPGAHSKTQVEGALALTIDATPARLLQSRTIAIDVTVDNTRTGHSMPSGSADLRLLWLEVTARIGDNLLRVPLITGEPEAAEQSTLYSLAGLGNLDARLIGPEIPKGSRVYRAIFADGKGEPTLNSYDAVSKLFDNRLQASEKRKESYRLKIPEGVNGEIAISATLKYLPYSSTFTSFLGLPEPTAVIVARREIKVSP